jgi:hypothetical protein
MIKVFAGLVVALGIASSAMAGIQTLPLHIDKDTLATPVAQGCGANRYRGPGGACHRFGRGPYPGGYYGPRPHPANGCPSGYWHGPWGHCRNTPYHGRLPNGGWK